MESGDDKDRARARGGAAFLLAQVGGHAAMRFAERLAPLRLTPPHAGILRAIARRSGSSQRELSKVLAILPSRLVALVDELEERGLVERRDDPDDRRSHALHLSAAGKKALEAIAEVGKAHNEALCAALNAKERQQLAELLARIADREGLTPGVHPGFRRLGEPGGKGGKESEASETGGRVARRRG